MRGLDPDRDDLSKWIIKEGTELALEQRMRNGCVIHVLKFFDGDVEKTQLWFETPNPMLGGQQPNMMIHIGRVKKLYEFITTALAENNPP